MALQCRLTFPERPARTRVEPLPRHMPAAGNRSRRLAIWSSLLFSWTWVKSLGHLTFQRFSECVFPKLLKGYGFERDVLDRAVIQLVAFPQEINALLRIRNDCDHPSRATDDSVDPQCAHLQSGFAGGEVYGCCIARLGVVEKRLKWIAARRRCFFHGRFF